MPASATASSVSNANIQGGHASRKTRRGAAPAMPSGVGASTTGVSAGAARPPPLSASCGCSRPPKLNVGARAGRRAVVAGTGGGVVTCGASGFTMLDTTGFETGAISEPRLLPAGVGETTAGLGSGLMSACAPATGSASNTLRRAQTQAVARIRLNDGRRVGRHRHSPLLAGTCTILLTTLRLPLVRLPRRRRTSSATCSVVRSFAATERTPRALRVQVALASAAPTDAPPAVDAEVADPLVPALRPNVKVLA